MLAEFCVVVKHCLPHRIWLSCKLTVLHDSVYLFKRGNPLSCSITRTILCAISKFHYLSIPQIAFILKYSEEENTDWAHPAYIQDHTACRLYIFCLYISSIMKI